MTTTEIQFVIYNNNSSNVNITNIWYVTSSTISNSILDDIKYNAISLNTQIGAKSGITYSYTFPSPIGAITNAPFILATCGTSQSPLAISVSSITSTQVTFSIYNATSTATNLTNISFMMSPGLSAGTISSSLSLGISYGVINCNGLSLAANSVQNITYNFPSAYSSAPTFAAATGILSTGTSNNALAIALLYLQPSYITFTIYNPTNSAITLNNICVLLHI